jgi:hypothetical protein
MPSRGAESSRRPISLGDGATAQGGALSMEIRPLLPDLFFRQLEEKDTEGLLRSIETASGNGEGSKHLLRAMRRYTGHHQAGARGIHPIIVVDAVADLVPTYGEDSPSDLLNAATRYLLALPTAGPRTDLFDPAPGDPQLEIIPISALEDALAEGSIETTCRTMGRLLRVIQTREYFLEVILEMVAPEQTPDGHLLIHSNAAVKALHDMEWELGSGIAYRLAEELSTGPLDPAPAISERPPAVPCRAAFLASMGEPAPERFWLYLAHAFQVERYAQMRPKAVQWGLRAWIADRLFDGDPTAMDCAEQGVGTRPEHRFAEKLPAPPEGIGWRIMESIASGRASETAEAMRWAQTLPDVDPLYRWIAAGTLPALAAGNPRPILAINAARWGSHLLGSLGAGILTERLMERLAALMEAAR